jgi:hypothetical protein
MPTLRKNIDAAKLDIPHSTDEDVRNYIINGLTKFEKLLEDSIDSSDGFIYQKSLQNAKNYIDIIVDSINKYFNALPHASYDVFSSYLNELKKLDYLPVKDLPADTSLYRVRIVDNSKTLSLKELFHPPIDARTKIKTQRFSIAGYPTLYLASALYVAWQELDERPYTHAFFSLYKLKSTLSVLDLTDTAYKEIFNETDELAFFQKFSMLYPLYFLCTLRVTHTADPFKPEYIFPQLVFAWVKENYDKILGVAYASTKRRKRNIGEFYNIALPIFYNYRDRNVPQQKYCLELAERFKCTEPLMVNDLKPAINALISKPPYKDQRFIFSNETFELIPYQSSLFWKVEHILETMKLKELKPEVETAVIT